MSSSSPGSTRRLFANSIANFLRGMATTIVTLVLPFLLVRLLPASGYTSWVLSVQLSTYILFLEGGMQVSIGKFVARETAHGNTAKRDAFVRTSLLVLGLLAVLGVLVSLGFAAAIPRFFPNLSASQVPVTQAALLWMGIGAAISLIASTPTGFFIGLERNKVPGMIVGFGRLLQCAVTGIAAWLSHSLLTVAIVYAVCTVLIAVVQFLAIEAAPDRPHWRGTGEKGVLKELLESCGNLTLWTVGSIMVFGLDVPIVGRFDFGKVVAYSLAASLVASIVSVCSVVLNSLLARIAALNAVKDFESVKKLLYAATRLSAVAAFAMSGVLYFLAMPVFTIWVGKSIAVDATPLFHVLLLTNLIRIPFIPYSIALMATEYQSLTRLMPITEGVVNVAASVWLATKMGAMGVAVGTLIGTFVAIAANLVVAMPRTKTLTGGPWPFLDAMARVGLVALLFVPGLLLHSVVWILGAVLLSIIVGPLVLLNLEEYARLVNWLRRKRASGEAS